MKFRICRDTPLYGGVMVVELVGPYAYRLTPEQWSVYASDPAVPDAADALPGISWAELSATFTVVASPL
jgi:hypothetical protein